MRIGCISLPRFITGKFQPANIFTRTLPGIVSIWHHLHYQQINNLIKLFCWFCFAKITSHCLRFYLKQQNTSSRYCCLRSNVEYLRLCWCYVKRREKNRRINEVSFRLTLFVTSSYFFFKYRHALNKKWQKLSPNSKSIIWIKIKYFSPVTRWWIRWIYRLNVAGFIE